MAYVRDTSVRNRQGLHLRPISVLVQAASAFVAQLFVCVEGKRVDARDPFGLMLLAAPQDTKIRIEGEGPDEREAVDALVMLFEKGFEDE